MLTNLNVNLENNRKIIMNKKNTSGTLEYTLYWLFPCSGIFGARDCPHTCSLMSQCTCPTNMHPTMFHAAKEAMEIWQDLENWIWSLSVSIQGRPSSPSHYSLQVLDQNCNIWVSLIRNRSTGGHIRYLQTAPILWTVSQHLTKRPSHFALKLALKFRISLNVMHGDLFYMHMDCWGRTA